MEQQERSRRLGLFLPLKLASYIVLMAVVVFWMKFPHYLHLQVIGYSILTLAFVLALSFYYTIGHTNIEDSMAGMIG